jgi:hypothetical protein
MRSLRLRATVGILSLATIAAVGVGSIATASPGSAAATVRTITSVTFIGDSSSPTIIVRGHGFLPYPPRSWSAANTSCGDYGQGNGRWYGTTGLWFQDVTNNWLAGYGQQKQGTCIGLVVDSWSIDRVKFHFGVAYGSFDHWTADAGDSFELMLRKATFSGVVTYQGSDSTSQAGQR